jgi:hypothetical protein
MIGNFVQETANAPGAAATVTLAGPAAGRRGILAAFGAGATVYLGMDDGTQWQLVEALTVAGPPQQITIATVINNSAGTTARLNFTGSVRIYSAIPAERNVYARADNSVSLAGDLLVSKAQPQIVLNKAAAGQSAWLTGQTNGSTRWQVRIGNDEAESGGNAGSNLDVLRYSDAGAFIDTPLAISRATGGANFSQRPTHAGAGLLTAGNVSVAAGSWTGSFDLTLSDTTFFDIMLPADTQSIIGSGFVMTNQTAGGVDSGVFDVAVLNASLVEQARHTATQLLSTTGALSSSGLTVGLNSLAAGNSGWRLRFYGRKITNQGPFNVERYDARILCVTR